MADLFAGVGGQGGESKAASFSGCVDPSKLAGSLDALILKREPKPDRVSWL